MVTLHPKGESTTKIKQPGFNLLLASCHFFQWYFVLSFENTRQMALLQDARHAACLSRNERESFKPHY